MRIGNGVDTVFDMGEELYSSGYLTFADEILSAETFVVSLSSHEQTAGSSTRRTVHALGRRTQGVHTRKGMDKIMLRSSCFDTSARTGMPFALRLACSACGPSRSDVEGAERLSNSH